MNSGDLKEPIEGFRSISVSRIAFPRISSEFLDFRELEDVSDGLNGVSGKTEGIPRSFWGGFRVI